MTSSRSYAIAVEVEGGSAEARAEIDKILERHGFIQRLGCVYLGSERVNAVDCVLATINLTRSLPWFAAAVRDIRMLRIEELNDLMPAVRQGRSE